MIKVSLLVITSIVLAQNNDTHVGNAWYTINPLTAFNANFARFDYNNGGCNGHWKDAKFMKPPYIQISNTSISANVVNSAVQSRACIYQHTQNTCNFRLGSNGLMQIEVDYQITGDRWSNWFSFWINSYKNGWVPEAEIDILEEMNKVLAHNFAGYGHQVPFKTENSFIGHITGVFTTEGARVTDCVAGSITCPMSGDVDVAYQFWSQSTANDIQAGRLTHHLVIDYWATLLASSLEISNIRLLGGGLFKSMCGVANFDYKVDHNHPDMFNYFNNTKIIKTKEEISV